MSTEQTHGSEIKPETASPEVEHINRPELPDTPPVDPAERYIATELQQTRVALKRTIIVGVVVLLFLGGELAYITNHFEQSLRPEAAAEIAEGYIAEQVNDKGPDLANQLKQKIPELIAQTPDYALKQMPVYRETLENRAINQLTQYAQNTQAQLGQRLDSFLADHKDAIKALATTGNDTQSTHQLGEDLKGQLMAYIQETPVNGVSIKTQIDQALVSLQDVEKTMHRLAKGKNLNAQEKKTRHAIAVLAQSIDNVRATHPATMSAINAGLSKVGATPPSGRQTSFPQ